MTTNIELRDYVPLNTLLNKIRGYGGIISRFVHTDHATAYGRLKFSDDAINRGKYFQVNQHILNIVPYLCLHSEWGNNPKILMGAFVRKCDVERFTLEYNNRTDLWLDYVHVYIAEDGITETINRDFTWFMKTARAWIKNNHIPVIKTLAINRYKFKSRKDAVELSQRAKEEIFSREYRLSLTEYFEEVPVSISTEEPIIGESNWNFFRPLS